MTDTTPLVTALRDLVHTLEIANRHPASVPADDLAATQTADAIRLLTVIRDSLPPGDFRAAATAQIAILRRHPIPAYCAEILGWASAWETLAAHRDRATPPAARHHLIANAIDTALASPFDT